VLPSRGSDLCSGFALFVNFRVRYLCHTGDQKMIFRYALALPGIFAQAHVPGYARCFRQADDCRIMCSITPLFVNSFSGICFRCAVGFLQRKRKKGLKGSDCVVRLLHHYDKYQRNMTKRIITFLHSQPKNQPIIRDTSNLIYLIGDNGRFRSWILRIREFTKDATLQFSLRLPRPVDVTQISKSRNYSKDAALQLSV
jgi:hypothetical protein